MQDIIDIVNRKPPSVLFHYSDFNGLKGIIINNEIWMGNLFFLNDEKEYKLGIDIFNLVLERNKVKYADSVFLIFLNSLPDFKDQLKTRTPSSFSLTEESDLLSQWRGYTKNGIGVSIGLHSENIRGDMLLLPCIYDRFQQEEYIEYIFSFAFSTFSNTKEEDKYDKKDCINPLELAYWDAINEAKINFMSHLNAACSIIKHPSFSEEKEWRLICYGQGNVEFISKETFLKPIIKAKIPPSGVIASITIGPNPNQNLCVDSIKEMTSELDRGEIVIKKSDIPYRN